MKTKLSLKTFQGYYQALGFSAFFTVITGLFFVDLSISLLDIFAGYTCLTLFIMTLFHLSAQKVQTSQRRQKRQKYKK